MDLKSLESELLKLSPKEKAAIAFKLLKELEDEKADGIEEKWINEALQRYGDITEEQKKLILDSYQQSESADNLIDHKAVISKVRNEL